MSLNVRLGSIMIRGMVIDMNDQQLLTLAQLQAFVDGTVAVDFQVTGEERYGFIARTLRRFDYARLKRPDKGVVMRFLERVSGYSRQQLTRLVKRVRGQGPLLKRYRASRTSFARTFSITLASCDKRSPCTTSAGRGLPVYGPLEATVTRSPRRRLIRHVAGSRTSRRACPPG